MLISNRFIPPGQGGIEMNDNIVYQRSAGVSGSPALTGVYPRSPEDDHLYEQLPGESEEAASYKRQAKDHDYVNDSQGQSMNEMKKKGTDNDDYYVNDDLFPEEYKTKQAAAVDQTKKNDEDYYVNDDLFPKHDEEEQHTSATSVHVKDSNGDGDYYVNDDLFPNSTTAKAAHSSHLGEGLAGAASVVVSEK